MRVGLLLAIAALAPACGTPSRRLPRRAIDDPITVPRRTMEVSLGAAGTASNEWRSRDASPIFGFRYGVTDRLEWNGLLAFDYALMDDAPVAQAATGAGAADAPFGLVVGGGLHGIGFSSIEGTIVQGGVGAFAVKHLGDRFRVSGGVNWFALHSELRDRSFTNATAGASWQALEWLKLRASVFDSLESAGHAPVASWRQHTVGSSIGVTVRPAHWIDVGGGVSVEALWNDLQPLGPIPPTESSPRAVRPPARRFPILWASLSAALRW